MFNKKKTTKKNKRPAKGSRAYRMRFLSTWMRAEKITYVQASAAAGFTRQNLYHLITRRDDMRLSDVINIIEAFGSKIEFSITRQENSQDNNQVMKDYSKLLAANHIKMPRLAFLQVAIVKYGFSNSEIAQKVELNQHALNYYFKNDDIFMSRLNQIANAMGATLNIRITKVIAPEEVTRPRLHTEIVIEKNYR